MSKEAARVAYGERLLSEPSSIQRQTEWLNRLLELETEADRRKAFGAERDFHDEHLFPLIHAELVRCLYADRARAFRTGAVADLAAQVLTDDGSQGIYQRCRGNLFFAESKHAEAVEAYEDAARLLNRAGREDEAGRVYFGGIQALIYLGRYEEAHRWAQEARVRFEKSGDQLRLGRLDLNIGNLCYRQDRYQEAMECYARARKVLTHSGQPQDFAAVLSNSAVCLESMGLFSEALACYREAQTWCSEKQLAPLLAAADYNVAYLHYSRGEYRLATDLYHKSRIESQQAGDSYHRALCDLDESEMMLELNMAARAQALASRAVEEFCRMKMPYEHGKALTYLGLARFQRGHSEQALKMLRKAVQIFRRENNRFWVGMIALYQAIIYENRRNWSTAQRLAERARKALADYQPTGKAAVCNLLLAKLALREDRLLRSRRFLTEAEKGAVSPALRCHISYLQGLVSERQGDNQRADHHFGQALATVEKTRNEFWTQELKISYLQDKTAIYEALTGLVLKSKQPHWCERSFALVQSAKSRTLLESLDARGSQAQELLEPDEMLLEAMRNLNASYQHLNAVASRSGESGKPANLNLIRERIRNNEETLAQLWQRQTVQQPRWSEPAIPWEGIVKALPKDGILVEFFIIENRIHAWLLSAAGLTHQVCGAADGTRRSLQLLQFQFTRLTLGPANLARARVDIERAVSVHLKELYEALISPIRECLSANRLIIAPNDFLHHVPYAALGAGAGASLLDDFTISTIPSGSIYYRYWQHETEAGHGSLILAAPDEATPFIKQEAETLAKLLPEVEVLVGDAATVEALVARAESLKYIHIAAHGLQRRDNPLFSAIRLGNSQLMLMDLDRLSLRARLITLSGCSTGVSVIRGGDELLGLMRGFLNTGAKAMLATLWDVSDEATAAFMAGFYKNLLKDPAERPASALRDTMLDSRNSGNGTYVWGAFQLAGLGQG